MSYTYFAPPRYLKKRGGARADSGRSADDHSPRAVETAAQSETLGQPDSRAGASSEAPHTGALGGDAQNVNAPASQTTPGAAPSPAAPAISKDGRLDGVSPHHGNAELPPIHCCECKTVMRAGTGPVSHGYCPPCFETAMREVMAATPEPATCNLQPATPPPGAIELCDALIGELDAENARLRALLAGSTESRPTDDGSTESRPTICDGSTESRPTDIDI